MPGDRPERFAKAAASGADVVVLDLEDAVAPAAKAAALEHVLAWLGTGAGAAVRVNASGTATHDAEIAALTGTGATVMLPKASRAAVDDVGQRLGGGQVLALVETAPGVRDVDDLAASRFVLRLVLGTVDLAAELGVDPSCSAAFAYARGRLVLASAAAGLPGPVDGVTLGVSDEAALTADVLVSRQLGLTGKLCIHPRQVAAVNTALSPTDAELAWAQRVVAVSGAGGVAVVDGSMVDPPVLARAQRLLGRTP